MGTTKEDIKEWIKRGMNEGATHMIVVCDTFDYDDYPIYVMPNEDARKKFDSYNGANMQKVMEVYNLKEDIEKQLSQYRAFNF